MFLGRCVIDSMGLGNVLIVGHLSGARACQWLGYFKCGSGSFVLEARACIENYGVG